MSSSKPTGNAFYTNGALPSPPDNRDWLAEQVYTKNAKGKKSARVIIPPNLDLRLDLQPIKNQGKFPTCVAQVAACMKEFQENIDVGLNKSLSVQYVYNHRSNYPADGMYGRDAMEILKTKGICRESVFAYESTQLPDQIPDSVRTEALRYTIEGYAKVETIDGLKESLVLNGPCYIAFPCYNYGTRFWIQSGVDVLLGGHAVTVIGYNEKGFILRNSWGESWGVSGYTTYPYEDWNAHWEIWTAIDAPSPNIEYEDDKNKCSKCTII